MKTDRRGFLKGLGGLAASLAAVVVMKPESLLKLPEEEPEEKEQDHLRIEMQDPNEYGKFITVGYLYPPPYLSVGFMCQDCGYRTYATRPSDDICPKCGELEVWRV